MIHLSEVLQQEFLAALRETAEEIHPLYGFRLPDGSESDMMILAAQEIEDLLDYIGELEYYLGKLKKGDCWCPMGINHPTYTSHTEMCTRLQDLFNPRKPQNQEGK